MALRIAKTKNGIIRGFPSGIPTVTVFKGIPYAAPPIGDLRWKAPQPHENWEGEYLAYTFGPIPPQDRNKTLFNTDEFAGYGTEETMSEDCLYLNIWTPAYSEEEKLPVMVWIHGGGFVEDYAYNVVGSGDIYASRHKVILITIEYRTGILGFLSHPLLTDEGKEKSSGNYGFLDQVFALQWIRDNIKAFGGDSENVTIFGQSAGGISVLRQLCSPLSEGLFHKAIIMSGTGYNGKYPAILGEQKSLQELEKVGEIAFKRLGVKSLEEARKLPVKRFIEVQREMPGLFWPGVDGYFLEKTTDETIAAQEHANVPIIIGCVSEESGLFKVQGSELAEIADDGFQIPAFAFAELTAEQEGRKPLYFYWFSRSVPGLGPWHALEMHYMFHTLHRKQSKITQQDLDVADAMSAYWCNFAKNGDPNGNSLCEWPEYTKESRRVMELGDVIRVIDRPLTVTMNMEVERIMGRL